MELYEKIYLVHQHVTTLNLVCFFFTGVISTNAENNGVQRLPVQMSDYRFDDICERIYRTYPNACVLFIDEVVNPELLSSYNSRKKSIKNATERSMFHGTSAEAVDLILQNGFDPTLNKVSAFGKGTYFAQNASYSFSYMKTSDMDDISYMILANVLIGRCTRASSGQDIDTTRFDNSVDSQTDTNICVTPYTDGAYPQYVIAFYKNAL